MLNKIDLIDEAGLNEIQQILDIYRKLNYQVLLVSNITGEGINELKEVLVEKNNIFVGQSGVLAKPAVFRHFFSQNFSIRQYSVN